VQGALSDAAIRSSVCPMPLEQKRCVVCIWLL